jgi:hypothetical protein
MSTVELFRYIGHLADNEQAAQQYEIQFWKRALYPFACLVMMALALPFAYLSARAGGISLKVFAGIMLGISFVLLNNMSSHLGLLRNWTPWIVAAAPRRCSSRWPRSAGWFATDEARTALVRPRRATALGLPFEDVAARVRRADASVAVELSFLEFMTPGLVDAGTRWRRLHARRGGAPVPGRRRPCAQGPAGTARDAQECASAGPVDASPGSRRGRRSRRGDGGCLAATCRHALNSARWNNPPDQQIARK